MFVSNVPVVIDASSLINMAASGHLEELLQCITETCCICHAVKRETLFVRTDEGSVQPIDCEALIDSRLLAVVDLTGEEEDLFVSFAAQVDDGEAMCLAIAQSRKFTLLSDDVKARRLASTNGVPVIGSARVIKQWGNSKGLDAITQVLRRIEKLARFTPPVSDPDSDWWLRR